MLGGSSRREVASQVVGIAANARRTPKDMQRLRKRTRLRRFHLRFPDLSALCLHQAAISAAPPGRRPTRGGGSGIRPPQDDSKAMLAAVRDWRSSAGGWPD